VTASAVVIAHAGSTLAMTGLIWLVQIVQYPLFARVGVDGFVSYHREHVRRTTWVVAPLMLTELMTAAWLVIDPPSATLRPLALVGLALLAAIWLSTVALQIPCHRKLEAGLDQAVVRRLVTTNWLRTVGWTARAATALWIAAVA